MQSKFLGYWVTSLAIMTALIVHATYLHSQFYPTVVWLTTSKISRVSIANTTFVVLSMLGNVIKWVFFGTLKPSELEKLHENAFYFVATTCLALTIFREHITTTIVAMFVICLFVKIFHWLAQSREEYLEQDMATSGTRLFLFCLLLLCIDLWMSATYIAHLLTFGSSVRLLLALEFLIMTVTSSTTTARFVLHLVDARSHHRWENKGKYRFYLEIATDLVQCLLYMGFFGILMSLYGFPLHLMRELYLTVKSFHKAVRDFLRYRKLTAFLDERYPDATAEEIRRDPKCIICYDEMTDSAKKLSCGHIFHKHCLKAWMERNSKCPLCDKPTLDPEQEPPLPRPVPAAPSPAAAAAA
eukprot:RCo006132